MIRIIIEAESASLARQEMIDLLKQGTAPQELVHIDPAGEETTGEDTKPDAPKSKRSHKAKSAAVDIANDAEVKLGQSPFGKAESKLEGKTPSLEEIRPMIKKFVDTAEEGRNKIVAFFTAHGVHKVTELDPAAYPELLDLIK